jgi:predicted metal-dependent hydrolase
MKSPRVLRSSSGSLRLGGEELPYRVEWRRVKYPRLEFKTGNLLVILPPTYKNEASLLEKKKSWVLEKHRIIKECLEKAGADFCLFGEPFQVKAGNGGMVLDFEKKEIVCNLGDGAQLQKIREMLSEKLRGKILEKINEFSNVTGLRPSKVYIRRQRSKWASCSSTGSLSFNLRLISLPPRLIDYVVLHELLHLKFPRHHREFWKEVEKFFPDYRDLEKELLRYWFSTAKGGAWLFDSRASPSGVPISRKLGSEVR